MTVRKVILVVANVVVVALLCVQGQATVPTSIQFRFLDSIPVGYASEAIDGPTTVDIELPVEIDLVPDTAILKDGILLTISVSSGNATATDCATPTAGDFCLLTNNVTFDIGANNHNKVMVTINIFDDLIVEGTEYFTVTAGITDPGMQPGGVVPTFVPGTDTSTINIIDNDYAIFRFNPNAYTVDEDVAGGTQAVALELVSGTLSFSIAIEVLVTGGTATATADFGGPVPSVVTFLAGDGPTTFRSTVFTTVDDNELEPLYETILMSGTSQNALGQFQAGGDTAAITILDDEKLLQYLVEERQLLPLPLILHFSTTFFNTMEGTPTVSVCVNADNVQVIAGRTISVTVSVTAGSAQGGGVDYGPINCNPLTFSGTDNQECCNIPIIDDFLCEGPEFFGVSLSATDTNANVVSPSTATVSIADNDGINGSHFSIFLPSGKLLCYTLQGKPGFVFNLIANKKVQINAMFVPDSHTEEVTWLGSMGIIVQSSQYKLSNASYLKFEIKGKKIYIGDKVVLEAKNIEKLDFIKGKLTISEAVPFKDVIYPSVVVDLQDMGLNFTVRFMDEHLDISWHNTGIQADSYGLISQFFQKGVEIDTVHKILILPGKEPVPMMHRPMLSFMEREMADDQLCWTTMNPCYQGEGLFDGTWLDYLMNDILSTDLKFKK